MIDYVKGRMVEKNPSYVVVEANGIGYYLRISLNTFDNIGSDENCKLLCHYSVSVDVRSGASAHTLFGFADAEERDLFRHLVTVSGVSANTAQLILSSLSTKDCTDAIIFGDWATLKSVKGIGPKLAQRITSDLADKIGRIEKNQEISSTSDNTLRQEALSALIALGFDKVSANKAVSKAIQGDENLSVEKVVKIALKQL